MLTEGSLLLYKTKPAIITAAGDKYEIKTDDGQVIKVREKDVIFLHPGPCKNFQFKEGAAALLAKSKEEFDTARQMVAGAESSAAEVAELVAGSATPESVWAAVADAQSEDGHFALVEGRLRALTDEEIAERERKKTERESAGALREGFLSRARAAQKAGAPAFKPEPEDARFLQEIEARAVDSAQNSKLLKDLKIEDEPEAAHALLLRLGQKPPAWNPYPLRLKLPLKAPEMILRRPETAGREDLTGMAAYAIDNAWSKDPDDAISFSDGKLWVHVADPASIIEPGSEADREARGRAATLYLPEGVVPMLPDAALDYCGLGLSELSPALSFGVSLSDSGEIENVEIKRSMTRVTRLTYETADPLLASGDLEKISKIAQRNYENRAKNEAIDINLPEIHLWVTDGHPQIERAPETKSSAVVREAMLLAGEALAFFAFRERIPFPFYGQERPADGQTNLPGLAGEYAKRRLMRAGQISGTPVAHQGLGLSLYTQATSPLRRYQDLLAHQQLRAFLEKGKLLDQDEIVAATGAAQAAASLSRKAERSAYQHWKLVWLMEHPEWEGEAIVVGLMGRRAVILIPELAFETQVAGGDSLELNQSLRVRASGIDLAGLEARFEIIK
jgi:exoribonuclease-2